MVMEPTKLSEFRVGNLILDVMTGKMVEINEDLYHLYRSKKAFLKGIEFFDNNFSVSGKLIRDKSNYWPGPKPNQMIMAGPQQIIVRTEIIQKIYFSAPASIRSYVMHNRRKVYFKYIHELQNLLMDAYHIKSTWQITPHKTSWASLDLPLGTNVIESIIK